MVNEINHREIRSYNDEGFVSPVSILSSSTGRHSKLAEKRSSDLQGLGMGVNLYLKLMKYLQFMFLILSIFSVPALMIF